MQWTKPRDVLTLATHSLNNLSKQDENTTTTWRTLRSNTLKKYANSCRYCGGVYDKYLICFYLDDSNKNLDVCCRMCHTVNRLNYRLLTNLDEIVLIHSKMSQLQIVRSTIDWVIKYNQIPSVPDIDPKAQKLNLSVSEMCSVLTAGGQHICKDFKLFFTYRLNTTFISSYITELDDHNKIVGKDMSMFNDPADSFGGLEEDVDSRLQTYKFTNDEQHYLDNLFDVSSKNSVGSLMKRKMKMNNQIVEKVFVL